MRRRTHLPLTSVALGLAVLACTLFCAVNGAWCQEPAALVKVHGAATPAALAYSLERAGFDVASCGSGGVEVVVTAPELRALEQRGLRIELVRGFYEDATPDARYKTDQEVLQILQAHAVAYPTIARVVNLNQYLGLPTTAENRSVYALKISDNPNLDEDEEAVLFFSNEHCRELVCIEVVLGAIDQVLTGYKANDPKIRSWVESKEIWFIPNANPDGLAYVWSTYNYWRKNRRHISGSTYGVDLNRNFAMGWASTCAGSTNPSQSTYKGPSALSEVEAQVIAALHRREHFAKVVSHHNSGREVLYPLVCSAAGLPPAVNSYLKGLDAAMARTMSYATRSASAEGEGYQWCFWYNSAFATLVESATAFQPAWSAVDPEVKRTWPGFQWVLDLPVPVSGHVTNKFTGAPIRADIQVAGLTYGNGEKQFSEPGFGRFHYFVPDGTYSFTFTADGYKPRTVAGVTAQASGFTLPVTMEPSAVIAISGSPRPGATLTLALSDPGMPSAFYAMHASLMNGPPIDLGHGDWLPLAADWLFFVSPSLTGVFENFYGALDTKAAATARVRIPADSALLGLTIHLAFASIDTAAPNAIGHVSAPANFQISN